MAVGAIVRSLKHRNFRLYFVGQTLSLVGTWMQITALPWLVYRLTDQPKWLGIIMFAGQFPACLLSPVAGVVVERFNIRRLLLLTQILSMVQAFGLAVLAFRGVGGVWPLLALNVGLSIVNAFDLTGRQAFLHDLLERKEDLGNAIALNSAMFNAARLVGPTLAGWMIYLIGEAGCFALNGFSFFAVLLALLAMRVASNPMPIPNEPSDGGMREGLRYVLANRAMTAILLLVGLTCFLGLPYTVLIPVYVKQVLLGGARMNGFMISAPGLGALTAGLFVASRRNVLGLLRFAAFLPAVIGFGLINLSYAQSPWVAAPLLFAAGFGVVTLLTTCNTTLQTIADADKRGRVVSLYAMVFLGLNPLGGLAAGWLAQEIGVQATFRVGGWACVTFAAIFVWFLATPMHDRAWAIYRQKTAVVAGAIAAIEPEVSVTKS
jgi:MFS family permease